MIFVDTSAFLAILAVEDDYHQRAEGCLRDLRKEGHRLITNSYVLLESVALIQKRLGLERVRDFQTAILPLLRIEWIKENEHEAAIRHLLFANRRNLSLVDCSAFETMRQLGIDTIFTFDAHFREQGLNVIP
jgi:predicted nucleic acid-binding protein